MVSVTAAGSKNEIKIIFLESLNLLHPGPGSSSSCSLFVNVDKLSSQKSETVKSQVEKRKKTKTSKSNLNKNPKLKVETWYDALGQKRQREILKEVQQHRESQSSTEIYVRKAPVKGTDKSKSSGSGFGAGERYKMVMNLSSGWRAKLIKVKRIVSDHFPNDPSKDFLDAVNDSGTKSRRATNESHEAHEAAGKFVYACGLLSVWVVRRHWVGGAMEEFEAEHEVDLKSSLKVRSKGASSSSASQKSYSSSSKSIRADPPYSYLADYYDDHLSERDGMSEQALRKQWDGFRADLEQKVGTWGGCEEAAELRTQCDLVEESLPSLTMQEPTEAWPGSISSEDLFGGETEE